MVIELISLGLVIVAISWLACVVMRRLFDRSPAVVEAWLLRWRIRRVESLCRRNKRSCEACSHWFVQDLFAEQVRKPEEDR